MYQKQMFPKAMWRLIQELSRLPSIGEKSAVRLASYLVHHDQELAGSLARALVETMEQVRLCQRCFFLTEEDLCPICENEHRDRSVLCVVEKPIDVVALEQMEGFRGYYHVLHGLWSPLRGKGPEELRLDALIERICEEGFSEVILATSATVEGDATALYISRLLQDVDVRITRPAQGIPKGGEVEYADQVTLSRAFRHRNVVGAD